MPFHHVDLHHHVSLDRQINLQHHVDFNHANLGHQVDLNHHDQFSSLLAHAPYSASGSHDDTSHHRIEHFLNNLKVEHPEFGNELNNIVILDSSYDFTIIKNDDTCYLLVRGTDLSIGQSTALRDIYNDSLIGLGQSPNRVDTIETHLIRQMNENPTCNWEAIGHSMGGRIVEDIGVKHPEIRVTSFQAARTPWDREGIKNILTNKYHDNITSHKIIGDPISVGPSPGTTIYHSLQECKDLICHSLDNYNF